MINAVHSSVKFLSINIVITTTQRLMINDNTLMHKNIPEDSGHGFIEAKAVPMVSAIEMFHYGSSLPSFAFLDSL